MFWALLSCAALWGGTALWVQFPQHHGMIMALFGAALMAVITLRLTIHWGWPALFALWAVLLGWYVPLEPRLDRNWDEDVRYNVTGDVAGDTVTLHNVRNFIWHTDRPVETNWQERRFDLTRLVSTDIITSVWDYPAIAHLIVSFGFDDGRYIAFSVEIRKEQSESFSSIGGFFRQYELILIAAEETDIIKLRTNYRHEDVRLYPVYLTKDQMRALFIQYVNLGNDLAVHPHFYNTLTANCTSVVWRLTKILDPSLKFDISLVLTGYVPDHLDRLGILRGSGTLAQKKERAKITEKARRVTDDSRFSTDIRKNGPDTYEP